MFKMIKIMLMIRTLIYAENTRFATSKKTVLSSETVACDVTGPKLPLLSSFKIKKKTTFRGLFLLEWYEVIGLLVRSQSERAPVHSQFQQIFHHCQTNICKESHRSFSVSFCLCLFVRSFIRSFVWLFVFLSVCLTSARTEKSLKLRTTPKN